MPDTTPSDAAIGELSRQASAFAESLARQELGCEVFAETVGHELLWTEFRQVFKQHMRIWQEFTTVALALAADNSVAGWLVENRKTRSGQQILTDADLENRARSLPQIRRHLRMVGVRRVPLADQRSMAVTSFAGQARTDACEVSVNHTTGEVIGAMPIPAGRLSPLAANDGEAGEALDLAWRQVEADVKQRLGSEAAAQARDLLKLIPQSAAKDEEQRSFWIFRVWRFFSTCDVSIDDSTKEIVGWYLEARQGDSPNRAISEVVAVQAALPELKANHGVGGPQVTFGRANDFEMACVHWWHAEADLNIEGDQTTVLLNATTAKPYSVWRKWRKISPELLSQSGITQEQAVQAADRAINRSPSASPGKVLGKSVIQVAANPEQPSPVRDALVWRIGYSANNGMSFTDVAVDCKTGECLRITGW